MNKKSLIAIPLILLVSGCQLSPPVNNKAISAPVQVRVLQTQRMTLWEEDTLREAAPLPFSVIRSDSDRITLSWNGDAVELLRDLARARGQVFSYVGVRLPLPVDIEVQGITYANLLRIIEMQTAWRATMVTYPGQMVLQFMPTVPAEPGRYKGGRR